MGSRMKLRWLLGFVTLTAASLAVALSAGVPIAEAAPSLICSGTNPGGSGVLDVAVSGSSSVSDSLKITESGGNYSLSLTSGGSTGAVCTGTTYPDSGSNGFPTVEVTGSTLLSTTFVPVDGNLTFQGQNGVSNTLDLTSLSYANISVPLGIVTAGANIDFFSGITTFQGSTAGNTDFAASGTGGYTFDGFGSGNVLNLGAAGSGVTASVPAGTVTLASGSDQFSDISAITGSSSGGTTTVAGPAALTFLGQGTGNKLDFSQVSTSSLAPLWINASGAPATSPYGTLPSNAAASSLATYHYLDVSTFAGSGNGNTTFLGDGAGGDTFFGGGSGNVLDLSAAGTGVSVSLASHTVSGLTSSNDSFTGIGTVDGPAAGDATFTGGSTSGFTFNGAGNGNTFVPGSGSGTFNAGVGGGNTLDFSNVATSQGTPLKVNVSGTNVGGVTDNTGVVGGTTYTFSGFTTFSGASSGNTDLIATGAAGGYSFGFAGSGDTLDLSALPAGATVSVVAGGTAQWGGNQDTFSGTTAIDGSAAGYMAFLPGATGGYAFNGSGAANTLDLTATGSNVTASVPGGTVTMTSGSDAFSGVSSFIGSSSGGTTLQAGATALTFQGKGTGNELDLSQVASSGVAPVWVNVSGSPVTSYYGALASDHAESGVATYAFDDVTNFFGPAGGNTTFVAGSTGGFSFVDDSSANVLDLSGAGSGVSVSVGTVSGLTGGNDTFAGLKTINGPSAGGATFTGGSGGATSGYTFNSAGNGNAFKAGSGSATFNGGSGAGNTLDFSAVPTNVATPLRVNLSGSTIGGVANSTAAFNTATYTFAGVKTFTGPATGYATFFAGPTGGYTFNGGGSPTTLDLSAAPSAIVTVNGDSLADPGTVTGLTTGTDGFSGIQSFAGGATILYRLSVGTTGDGTGSVTSSPAGIDCGPTCSYNFTSGATVTLTATPSAGSAFAGWSGACTGTGQCSIPVTSTTAVSASFTLLPSYTLSVAKSGNGSGTVTSSPTGIDCGAACSHDYASGTSVTLTAAAAAGSAFEGWSGACTGKSSCTIAVTAAQSVHASFLKECVVPKVKGKSVKAAERLIKGHDCRVGKIAYAFSSTAKKGSVISQKPGPGQRRPPGARVDLVVSKGKQPSGR